MDAHATLEPEFCGTILSQPVYLNNLSLNGRNLYRDTFDNYNHLLKKLFFCISKGSKIPTQALDDNFSEDLIEILVALRAALCTFLACTKLDNDDMT